MVPFSNRNLSNFELFQIQKSFQGSTCPATKAKSGSHFGLWKGLVSNFEELPSLHILHCQVSGACKVTFENWEKMAKSWNLPKWHTLNPGWTRLLFALPNFRIFRIYFGNFKFKFFLLFVANKLATANRGKNYKSQILDSNYFWNSNYFWDL